MKGNLGSEVLLRVETLSEDNPATTDSLRAPDHTLVCQVMMDGQGCHHLQPTP
jgi:hypothetical protein